jgi:hypothetical protein
VGGDSRFDFTPEVRLHVIERHVLHDLEDVDSGILLLIGPTAVSGVSE